MSSPSGRRRPLSTSDYEPLLQANRLNKPKLPPKPKPQLLKSSSNTAVLTSPGNDDKGSSGGYFQPGGATGIGYCLSSMHKTKLGPRTSNDVGGDGSVKSNMKSQVKPSFGSQDSSRPLLSSLPSKFRASFEQRNQTVMDDSDDASKEPATGLLVAISESDSHPQTSRRPPPPIPNSNNRRMTFPSASTNPSVSLPAKLGTVKSPCLESQHSAPDKILEKKGSPTSEMDHAVLSASAISTAVGGKSSLVPVQPVTYAQPPPRELDYIEREHPRNTFEYLDKLRHRDELCDVTLIANSKELRAHRVVLAACSNFFESMFIGEFAEPPGEPVIIDELSDDALEAMINFAYTSHINITEKNVYSLFDAAELLLFNGVKAACFKFFKQQINKSNCIRTWLFAESHNCNELLDASLKFIECNFLEIARGKEFLYLDQHDVVVSITSRENLAITSEEEIYEAVLSWIQIDLEKRRKYALEVFKSVRFPSMSKDYLMHIVDNESVIKEDPDLLQLLIDALQSHMTTTRGTLKRMVKKNGSGEVSNIKPRAASMAVEVCVIERHNGSLGIRIMGGKDRPHHVFSQGDKPGVFILCVVEDGAAARAGKLKAGDRILQVNDADFTKVTHEEAIRILKTSSDPITLLIRHEPPPAGMRELTLVTKPGEGFGFVITGGVNGYPGNPFDDTDEGIFISQIIPGGAAELDNRLNVGTRILQVNSVSLFGKTHDEALKVLQGVLDRLNLLVCDGYDPNMISMTESVEDVNWEGEAYL